VQDKGKRFHTTACSRPSSWAFLIDLAEVLVVSALARTESRGGHFREDYGQARRRELLRHTMAYPRATMPKANVNIRLDYKPVVQTRYKPMERKY